MTANRSCHNHPNRDSVAKCPSCGFLFCRECVVEHDGKMLCAACLKKGQVVVETPRKKILWGAIFLPVRLGLCLFAAWFFFYVAGQMLLNIPTSFHDGSMWDIDNWTDQ